MNLLLGLAERILFAAALIVGLQLPAFVAEYTGRIQAEHQRVVETLGKDDAYRQRNAQPDTEQFIAVLEPGMRAELEAEAAQRAQALAVLQRASLPEKLWSLLLRIDEPTAMNLLQTMTPTLSLHADAVLCGLVLAIIASLLFQLLRGLGSLWASRRRRLRYAPPSPRAPIVAPPPTKSKDPVAATPIRREPRAL